MPRYRSEPSHHRIEVAFDSEEIRPVTPYSEELRDDYQETRSALQELRQREEQIRREADQLEEINQKEELFHDSKRDTLSRLETYVDLLDHEVVEAKRLVEDCLETRQRFHHHLNTISQLRADAHDRDRRHIELDSALEEIEVTAADIAAAMPLIDQITSGGRPMPRRASAEPKPSRSSKAETTPLSVDRDFFYFLKAGFAFTLPIMILATLFAIVRWFL